MHLDSGDDEVRDSHCGFNLGALDRLFSKGLRTVKSIPPKCRLGFSRALKRALDKVVDKPDDISRWVSLLVLPLCLLRTFRREVTLSVDLVLRGDDMGNILLMLFVLGKC